ncbi:MAG TPA: ion transporter [Candidatus Limnocylindrales bacterium]|nr:ion transporter [Candidatus Limnocylindrales bacterium]
MTTRRPTLREEYGPGYELFIVALSALSLFNVVVVILPIDHEVKEVARIVDLLLAAIFMADFAGRLYLARPRRDYFIDRQGWADLLGSLPFPFLRVFRIVRLVRAVHRVEAMGGRKVVRELIVERHQTALLVATFFVIAILEFGSMFVLGAERDKPAANIKTGGDALWWAVVSIATVGYGDRYPVTPEGRVVGVALIIGGVGLFGVFTGFLARVFLTPVGGDRPAGAVPSARSDEEG